jgi:hypothetical protein
MWSCSMWMATTRSYRHPGRLWTSTGCFHLGALMRSQPSCGHCHRQVEPACVWLLPCVSGCSDGPGHTAVRRTDLSHASVRPASVRHTGVAPHGQPSPYCCEAVCCASTRMKWLAKAHGSLAQDSMSCQVLASWLSCLCHTDVAPPTCILNQRRPRIQVGSGMPGEV